MSSDRWSTHDAAWRDPAEVGALWREAGTVDPRLLSHRAARRASGTCSSASDAAGHARVRAPRDRAHVDGGQTHMPLPHPSGLAVDRERVHIASTRNPNQVFELRPADGRGARRSAPVPAPRFLPGRAVPPRPRARRRACTATPSGRTPSSASTATAAPRASGGRVDRDATAGPTSGATTSSSTRSPPARTSRASYFSASAAAPSARRPGHRNFPVDGRGVIFSGCDARADRGRAHPAALRPPARRRAVGGQQRLRPARRRRRTAG